MATLRRDGEEERGGTLELADAGEARVDPATGRFLSIDPRMCDITGYTNEELLGMTLLDITHTDDREEDFEHFRRMVSGEASGEPAVGKRYVRKDGRVAWVSTTATVDRDRAGKALSVVMLVQDVTERKKAEEVSRQQAGLLEQTHDAVFIWEFGGGITYWNLGAERLYGWSREEALGCASHELLKTIHPFPTEEFDRELRIEGQWEGELVHHTRDDRRVMVESRHLLTRYEAGSGFVMETNRDVTERKEAEKALRDIREAERRRIARDLHDEPLQDLVLALEEMRATRARTPEAGLDRAIGALERATLGLRGAIYDLRLEGDREQSLVEMLGSLVELAHRNWPGCEVEFLIEGYSSPALSREREVELLRIVQEALTNARRHSGASHAQVALGSSGDGLWVEVSDDGRGFDPEALAGTGTTGMRERALALGGDLTIASEPGEGTRVRLEVTLEDDGEESQEEEIRVLLVEDHASFRQAVVAVFEKEPGFAVVGQAGSLEEARALLEAEEPVDVAIVDLTLMDGYGGDLIRDLAAAACPRAMALVLTASPDRAEMARAVEAGAAGVLHKSAGLDEVVDAVRRLRAGESLLPPEEVVELLRIAGSRKDQEYEARQAIAQLTPREKEVLQALARGFDGKEIARRLSISDKTESNHVASILAKLGVHSRLQALVFALRHGVVDVR